jgi:hypothetical protein
MSFAYQNISSSFDELGPSRPHISSELRALGLYKPPDWTTTGPFGRLALQVTCRALSILLLQDPLGR